MLEHLHVFIREALCSNIFMTLPNAYFISKRIFFPFKVQPLIKYMLATTLERKQYTMSSMYRITDVHFLHLPETWSSRKKTMEKVKKKKKSKMSFKFNIGA